MRVYRVSKTKYAHDLSGEGARRLGGRWNSKGTSVLYTACNSSLAILEKLVHIPPFILPKDLKIIVLEIPDTIILDNTIVDDLPSNWISRSEHPKILAIGDQFILDKKYVGLRVPSAINILDQNILLNPAHPDFKDIKIIDELPIDFDRRLLREV